MKILPLALLLVATPAFAQVSTPALRRGSPAVPPKTAKVAKTAGPAAPATAAPDATPRPAGRTSRAAAPKPTQGQGQTAPAEASASKPKKRGFFGFFGKLFGGGKKKAGEVVEPSATQGSEVTAATAKAQKSAAPGAIADHPGSSIRPTFRERTKKPAASTTRPAIDATADMTADRSSTIPAAPAKRTGNVTRPPAVTPAPESANPPSQSSIKPVVKAAAKPAPKESSTIPNAPSGGASTGSSLLPGSTGSATSSTGTAGTEFDKARYLKIKREAAADPGVLELSAKLNATAPGSAYKKAARAYSNALFSKMREIDPSQTEWVNRMEAATVRRIDAGKAFVAE